MELFRQFNNDVVEGIVGGNNRVIIMILIVVVFVGGYPWGY